MASRAKRILLAVVASTSVVPAAAPSRPATLVLKGLARAPAVAGNAQAAPFVAAADGRILHVAGLNVSDLLVNTGGSPEGLAFGPQEELYVADSGRNAILKVTPWGEVSVFADRCGGTPLSGPSRIVVSPDGTLYFNDPGASRICRAGKQGAADTLATGIRATALAFASAAGRLFAATEDGKIWQFSSSGKGRTLFATLAGTGVPSGIAIDETGTLYIARDGGGRISVIDAKGGFVEDLPVPGPRVTGIAFAGSTLRDLFVTESETGSLYRIATSRRSQRLPWETDPALAITEPVDGAILNRHDGEVTPSGLRIVVKGRTRLRGPVRVNGATVSVRDGQFETQLTLSSRETAIRAESGDAGDRITVLWDRDSFPRFRVSTDDNIWWLRDIAQHADTYHSLFENPYLAFWRSMHEKYGAKVHFNIYYETQGFNLSQMPDKFRPEWQKNAGWIRLTFHARANDPDRPYVHSSAEKIRADYRLVTSEIERFAGKELLSPVTTVHWGGLTRAGAHALREEGVSVLVGYFDSRDDLPDVCYYLPLAQWRYMSGRDYWKDTREDILMVRHDMVINLFTQDRIVPRLEQIAADPHQAEIMELMIHEQYFYPDYVAYEPDYRERVETAIKWAVGRGYKPVFYGEGFLGAPESK